MRSLVFDEDGFEDLLWWIENDRRMAVRLGRLIRDIRRDPFTGLGKPEPLHGNLSGAWSRRIDREHRLVYQVSDSEVRILACRFHYEP